METGLSKRDELLRDLLQGRLDVAAVVEAMSDEEVAAWRSDAAVRDRALLAAELGRLQAGVTAGRFGSTAVNELLGLAARAGVPPETVRKACVDVLNQMGEAPAGLSGPRRGTRLEVLQNLLNVNIEVNKGVA